MLYEGDRELVLLLWQLVRDVRLWSALPVARRAEAFAPLTATTRKVVADAVAANPTLRWPLRTLEAMVTSPLLAKTQDVGQACTLVSEWAEANHMPEFALQFADAAARTQPRNAQASAVAGTLYGRAACEGDARVWFYRAIRVARATKDWEWYIRSYIRLGVLVYELGDYPRAYRYFLKARRKAAWCGRPAFEGQGTHGMFTIVLHVGPYEQAAALALEALAIYPVHYERIPHLAHDFAFLLVRHAYYSRALLVLDAVLPTIPKPHERIVVLGSVARAAAGMRDFDRYARAAGEVRLLAEISEEGAAMAFVHLAEGARTFGEYDEAERLAARAVEVAMRRRESDNLRQAYASLDRIVMREPGHANRSKAPGQVDAAVAAFLESLQTQSAPVPKPGAPAITTSELPIFTGSA